jgi:hypothetical protein
MRVRLSPSTVVPPPGAALSRIQRVTGSVRADAGTEPPLPRVSRRWDVDPRPSQSQTFVWSVMTTCGGRQWRGRWPICG